MLGKALKYFFSTEKVLVSLGSKFIIYNNFTNYIWADLKNSTIMKKTLPLRRIPIFKPFLLAWFNKKKDSLTDFGQSVVFPYILFWRLLIIRLIDVLRQRIRGKTKGNVLLFFFFFTFISLQFPWNIALLIEQNKTLLTPLMFFSPFLLWSQCFWFSSLESCWPLCWWS